MDIRILVPILVFAVGVYFIVRLGWVLIRTKRNKIDSFKFRSEGLASLFLAFAGTLGVGNIFGVATALIIGGAGSVFWLLVSAIFSSVIKYAEVALSLSFGDGGGMTSVIRKSFGGAGNFLSKLYAAVTLLLGVVMGFALQGGSSCECLYLSFGTPPIMSSVLMVLTSQLINTFIPV